MPPAASVFVGTATMRCCSRGFVGPLGYQDLTVPMHGAAGLPQPCPQDQDRGMEAPWPISAPASPSRGQETFSGALWGFFALVLCGSVSNLVKPAGSSHSHRCRPLPTASGSQGSSFSFLYLKAFQSQVNGAILGGTALSEGQTPLFLLLLHCFRRAL